MIVIALPTEGDCDEFSRENKDPIAWLSYQRYLRDPSVVKGDLRSAAAQGRWVAVPLWRENNVEVFLFDTHSGAVELRLRLFGAKDVALRFADDVLLCADDQGRILAQDVVTRKIIRDLRI
jgi:hypothetical protein